MFTAALTPFYFNKSSIYVCLFIPAEPTRSNILSAIRWLVEEAKYGDVLFFHYSGTLTCCS
jgi:hypothetical protein